MNMNMQLVYFVIKLIIYSVIAVLVYTCCVSILFLIIKLKDCICEQIEKRRRQRKEERL